MKRRDFGIVVIGRNEGRRLIDCLASLDPYAGNIVYVDSGSTDESVANATKYKAIVVQLDTSAPYTAARARNAGFAALIAARPDCKYVQFLDGDCQLVPTWLDAATAFIEGHGDVAVVYGRRRERYPQKSVYNRLCDIEWDTPVGEASACGGDSFMRVDAFQAVKGFFPRLIAGEEPELCARLRSEGWKIWRLAVEMTLHDAAILRFGQWWRRAVRSGHAEAEISWLSRSRGLAEKEQRAVISAAFWAGVLPLGIILGAFIKPAWLAFLFIYPIQIGRIAARRGLMQARFWIYALFIIIAKFAQLWGGLIFCWRHWQDAPRHLIEYK